jgi:dipeptidyl aminopeptidase/acylaminoacyl peptidase
MTLRGMTRLGPLLIAAALAPQAAGCGGAQHTLQVKNGPIAANWQAVGIYLVDPSTSARHLMPQTGQINELVWSPDGRRMAFELPGRIQGGDVYTSRADGSNRRLVLRNAHAPSWSPDGKRLLVVRDVCTDYYSNCIDNDFRVDLYTVRLDGKELHRVVREPNANDVAWSPDGKQIALVAINGDVYLIDADDGSHKRRLGRGSFVELAWSPDGSKLAVAMSGRAPNWGDIGVVDVKTGRLTNLTHRPGDESGPAWSPDGRKIVFTADMNCGWTGTCQAEPGAEGPRELWLMDAGGEHLRQLTRNGGLGYGGPAWKPQLESPNGE